MKKSIFLVCVYALLGTTSCTKDSSTTDSTLLKEHDIQTALVGSWQFVEKGVELAMHEGHICTDPENMPKDQITYILKWENASIDDNRNFKKNGAYSSYGEATTPCQGTYKVSAIGFLEVQNNCENYVCKIEEVTSQFLTIKQVNLYSKYRRVN